MADPLTVLLVADQSPMLRGLRMRLELEPDLRIVGEATAAHDGAVLASQRDPDVVVLSLSELRDPEIVQGFNAAAPRSRLVILALHEACASSTNGRATGAVGHVSMRDGPEALLGAVRAAAPPAPSTYTASGEREENGRGCCDY